jgi:hypothetical protein
MTIADFCHHRELLDNMVTQLEKLDTGLVLDQVSEPFSIKDLKQVKCIKALKLAFDLVHNIDESLA